jgi:hypothetical protein
MRVRAVLFAASPSLVLPSAIRATFPFPGLSTGIRNYPPFSRHLAAGLERLIPIRTRFIPVPLAEDGRIAH